MIVLGGVTRLTNSGLSIVEWKPISGVIPPLTDSAWQEEFAKYQTYPEFQKRNTTMSLEAFKGIFWWEYAHRILGRMIGLVIGIPLIFLVPASYFRRSDHSIKPWVPALMMIFILGGLQGGLGWFMVASGLVDRPDVSHYRLTAHLGLAVIIFGALLWVAFGLLRNSRSITHSGHWRLLPEIRWANGAIVVVYLQILSGGLVAGLDAGFIYNTWPLMDGAIVPPDWLVLDPWWMNFLENIPTVQFLHRSFAYGVVLVVCIAWWRLRKHRAAAGAALLMLFALVLQIGLGLTTLLLVVPTPIAAAHQAGAMLLFAAILNLRHRLLYLDNAADA